jgi:hypothetical protein
MNDIKPFVRYVEGRFVLTWTYERTGDAAKLGPGWNTRPLTLKERALWQLFQKVPKP